ncbi:MAG: hypothetical protein QOH31_171 [Verrucomicrobiota bacterium]
MNLIGSQKAKLPSWRKMCRVFSIAGLAVGASFVFEGCGNTGSYGYGDGGYYGDDLYGYGEGLFVGGTRHGEHFGGHHMIGSGVARGGGFGRGGGGFGGGHGGGGGRGR